MSEQEKIILVTNDDGMFAPGLHALVNAMKDLGKIYIVSPDSPQSGKGHGITLRDPIRFNRVYTFEGIEAYECSGTPVDCVKWAKKVLLKDQVIDLCVSGINHGANASINIIYSGTMSAAMEAAMEGVHSVGFSLLDFSFEADFSAAEGVARRISEYMLTLEKEPRRPLLLNVNIPTLPEAELKGIKICRQANARWVEDFQEGIDPRGMKYFWMAGELMNLDNGSDTDINALENGYVSVVPCQFDLTDYAALDKLKGLMDDQ